MEDLGKLGPSRASPVPRHGVESFLQRLRGDLSFLYLGVRWGCCRGGSNGATLPAVPPPISGDEWSPGSQASTLSKMESV